MVRPKGTKGNFCHCVFTHAHAHFSETQVASLPSRAGLWHSAMADDGPARWRTAQAGLSFIQTIGGKLEQAAGTVAHAAQVAATAVKDNIIDGGEFDRIRSFQQELARQGRPQKARHYSEAEWEEAERKADEVLSQFYPGYFTQDFDPVEHELEQLTSEAGQEEIDAIVERLTTGVEVGADAHA